MEEMTLEEFNKEYRSEDSKWDFKKFAIQCAKCTSTKVEFNGFLESEGGYYGDHSLEGAIIVKCHDCGNAFRINAEYELELNKDGERKIGKCDVCGEKSSDWDFHGVCSICKKKIKKDVNVGEGVA